MLATGGCAFLSHVLGCNGNTGDGYLMAAEAGVRLSVEFSSQYGLSPAHPSVTKGLTFTFASFYLEDGSPLPETGEDRAVRIARQLIAGEKVYALMNRGNPIEHEWLRQGQPNCFLPFERMGLDPFQQPFPVTLRSEGTVRGVGGLEIINDDCATKVPGLMPQVMQPLGKILQGQFQEGEALMHPGQLLVGLGVAAQQHFLLPL